MFPRKSIRPNMDIEQIHTEENNSCGESDIHYCIYDDGEGMYIVFKYLNIPC